MEISKFKMFLEPGKKEVLEVKEEETEDSYTEESMESSEVIEDSEITVYEEPLKSERREVKEVAPCSQGDRESREALTLLNSWNLRPATVTTLIGLGFDRPATLEVLTSWEIVKDIEGISFAEKALLCQRSKQWCQSLHSPTNRSQDGSASYLSSPNCPARKEASLVWDLMRTSSDPHVKLLSGVNSSSLTPLQQKKLTEAVVEHLLSRAVAERPHRPSVSYSELRKWAESIQAQFPGETARSWFHIQPRLSDGGGGGGQGSVVRRPRGRLWERYNNRRRTFTTPQGKPISIRRAVRQLLSDEDEGVAAGPASSSEDLSPSSSAPSKKKKKLDLPNSNAEEYKRLLLTDPNYSRLKEIAAADGDVEDSAEFLLSWRNCAERRLAYLKVSSFDDYTDLLSFLSLSHIGYKLVQVDFAYLHPQLEPTALLKGLAKYREAILMLATLEKAKQRTQERKLFYKERIDFYLSAEPAQRESAALLLLPLIVQGGLSRYGGRKVSTIQSAECFIQRAISLPAAEEVLEERRRELPQPTTSSSQSERGKVTRGRETVIRGGRIQPLLLAIGGDGKSWSTVEKYLLYIDRPLYEFDSLVEAVDACFKATFVFDLHYSPECEGVWQVVQNKFYNLQTANERVLRSADSCMKLLDTYTDVEDSQTEV